MKKPKKMNFKKIVFSKEQRAAIRKETVETSKELAKFFESNRLWREGPSINDNVILR